MAESELSAYGGSDCPTIRHGGQGGNEFLQRITELQPMEDVRASYPLAGLYLLERPCRIRVHLCLSASHVRSSYSSLSKKPVELPRVVPELPAGNGDGFVFGHDAVFHAAAFRAESVASPPPLARQSARFLNQFVR